MNTLLLSVVLRTIFQAGRAVKDHDFAAVLFSAPSSAPIVIARAFSLTLLGQQQTISLLQRDSVSARSLVSTNRPCLVVFVPAILVVWRKSCRMGRFGHHAIHHLLEGINALARVRVFNVHQMHRRRTTNIDEVRQQSKALQIDLTGAQRSSLPKKVSEFLLRLLVG